jgi:two-component system KDP operon response regulator KdpE
MAPDGPLILIVEDEEPIRRFLRATLSAADYRLVESETGHEALRLAGSQPPDLVILDLGLPDMSGMDVLRQLRGWLQVPVIVLSAMGREADKVAALDVGADDYLTKPFGVRELVARIRVALRNSRHRVGSGEADPVFRVGELVVDQAARKVAVRGQPVHLTPTEYKLLTLLVKHAGTVLTHRFILEQVWGIDRTEEVQSLRVFMAGLRRKIETDPAQPQYLLTETGVGYRLADE